MYLYGCIDVDVFWWFEKLMKFGCIVFGLDVYLDVCEGEVDVGMVLGWLIC